LATTAHRILTRAAGREAAPGEPVTLRLDRALVTGTSAPGTLLKIRELGRPWSAEDLLLTMDFHAPEIEATVPRSRALCREIAEGFGLRHVFDLNLGIGTQVVLESSLVLPGQLVAGGGRCLGLLGGVGALALRLGEDDLARAVQTGSVDLPAPEIVRVEVSGHLPRYVGPLDAAYAILDAAEGTFRSRVLEVIPPDRDWSVDFRIALCGLLAEMGALAALCPADTTTVKFYKQRGVSLDVDGDATGHPAAKRITVDGKRIVAAMSHDYAGPHTPLAGAADQPVQGVFVGGCYGGRYEDMALVGEVLKRAGRVNPGVRLAVSPATLETARGALAAGFYETFLSAGAMVVVTGGGPGSAGGAGMFGEGERIGSTAEYHRQLHPGQGVPDVVLLSPVAAAVAAATGRLGDPSQFMA
jgi:homoaconitase/3-isopropylmalate dehydratase large subunit